MLRSHISFTVYCPFCITGSGQGPAFRNRLPAGTADIPEAFGKINNRLHPQATAAAPTYSTIFSFSARPFLRAPRLFFRPLAHIFSNLFPRVKPLFYKLRKIRPGFLPENRTQVAEKAMLSISGNGEYTVGIPSGNQRSTNGIPMVDPGKVRLGKVSIGKSVEAALPPTRPRFSPPIPPRNPPFCFAPAQRSHPAFTAAAALYIIYKYIYLTLSIILHINRKLYITYNSYYYAHSFFKAGVLDDSRSILSDRQ